MLKKIAFAVLILLVAFAVFVQLQPAPFRIERSVTVHAPADVAFALVNDFRQWERWNPFAKGDPSIKVTLSGPPSGVGAKYGWVGKDGQGAMEILESRPAEDVKIRLDFIKPMSGTNNVEFTFAKAAEGVKVSWVMTGDKIFIGKLVSLFVKEDTFLGPQFDKGLADIKASAEADAAKRPQAQATP